MKLYKELKKINEVVMFGQSSLYFFDKECKPMPRHNKKDRVKTSLRKSLRFLRKITILLRNRSLDKNKVITQTFDEFLAYIYSAKKVVACDNGIMNTARALGVPCIPIFGWTPKAYSEQYEEYSKASCEAIKCEYDHEGVDITDRINLILEKAQ
jgi:ADP-heptose:LPS heptosyltransferase